MATVNSECGPRRRLLLVSYEQFGYHTDSLEYCRHLRDRYSITYLCPDQGLARKAMEGVEVIHREHPPLGKVELGLLVEADRLLRRKMFDVVFLRRTKFSFLLRLRHRSTPMVFDVRSGSIEKGLLKRTLENSLLRANAVFFSHITVISEGLARKLGLGQRAHVLPLGADRKEVKVEPCRSEMRLIYVGTFKNRCLERTVEGLGEFAGHGAAGFPVTYTIVGFGSEQEKLAIRKAVDAAGLGDRVLIRDRVDRDELQRLFSKHNIGVAFTPQVAWFEHQPSTKLFEYLQSGLLCIATDSVANREIITSTNGVLISGSAEGFRRGLEEVSTKMAGWSPRAVADSVSSYTWEAIVESNLAPYLERVCV